MANVLIRAQYLLLHSTYPSFAAILTGMDRLFAATAGRALEEAQDQAEILMAALRQGASADGEFLLAHAQHLLACCREIADAKPILQPG